MHRMNTFHGFHLDDYLPFHENVDSLRANQVASVPDRHRLLDVHGQLAGLEFNPASTLVNRLTQARSKFPVNREAAPNDASNQTLERLRKG